MKHNLPTQPQTFFSHSSVEASSQKGSGGPVHSLTIRKILAAIDFQDLSPQVIQYGAFFARTFRARLTLLHVLEPAACPGNYLVESLTPDEANQNLMDSCQQRMQAFKQERTLQGVDVDVLVRIGRAYSEIPDTAKATDSNLIILGSCGRSGLKSPTLGGTAERVVRQAWCPVMFIGGAAH